MSDTKISALTEKTSVAAADEIVTVDSVSGLNRMVKISSILGASPPSATELGFVKGLSSGVQTQLNDLDNAITTGTDPGHAHTKVTNANSTTASDMFPIFSATQAGDYAVLTNSGFKFNPSTNALTANTFVGALTGTASGNATLGNVQSGTGIYFTSADGTTAYTLTPTPAIGGYAAGQRWDVLINATNTAGSTLAISGLAARNIYKINNVGTPVAIVAGDLIINTIAKLIDDGTQLILLNPPVRDTNLVLTDVTTGDVGTGAHGLQKKCTTAAQALGTGDSVSFANVTSTGYARVSGDNKYIGNVSAGGGVFKIINKVVDVTSLTGASKTSTAAIPAGSAIIGIHSKVITIIVTDGATTWQLGDGSVDNLWGSGMGLTVGSTGNFTKYPAGSTMGKIYPTAQDVVLKPASGNFSSGAVRLTIFYMSVED
jgi:hypothetical protein